MSDHSKQGGSAKPARQEAARVTELEKMIDDSPTPERVCLKLSQILRVERNEVALLRLEKGSLKFVYPAELRSAGAIPLSGSAVAARTAVTRAPLLSNSFARVKHASLFETVKLGGEEIERTEQMPIQKIISVPVVDEAGEVVGVVQLSRKGLDSSLAGVDFTSGDLTLLEHTAEVIARMPFMRDAAPL
jgi:hypothetical protein